MDTWLPVTVESGMFDNERVVRFRNASDVDVSVFVTEAAVCTDRLKVRVLDLDETNALIELPTNDGSCVEKVRCADLFK